MYRKCWWSLSQQTQWDISWLLAPPGSDWWWMFLHSNKAWPVVLPDIQRPDFFISLIEEQIGSVLGNMKMIRSTDGWLWGPAMVWNLYNVIATSLQSKPAKYPAIRIEGLQTEGTYSETDWWYNNRVSSSSHQVGQTVELDQRYSDK